MKRLQILTPIALVECFDALYPAKTGPGGSALSFEPLLNPEVPTAIGAGRPWDLALTNPPYLDALREAGQLQGVAIHPFVRSPLAFAKRLEPGEPPADLAEVAEVLAQAQAEGARIGFTEFGTSGAMLRTLLNDLGVTPTLIALPGGGPMRALLSGEVEIACLPFSNIAPVPQVATLAICPEEMGVHVDIDLVLRDRTCASAAALAEDLLDPRRDAQFESLGARRRRV